MNLLSFRRRFLLGSFRLIVFNVMQIENFFLFILVAWAAWVAWLHGACCLKSELGFQSLKLRNGHYSRLIRVLLAEFSSKLDIYYRLFLMTLYLDNFSDMNIIWKQQNFILWIDILMQGVRLKSKGTYVFFKFSIKMSYFIIC